MSTWTVTGRVPTRRGGPRASAESPEPGGGFLDHDEFTIFLFILEHLALVSVGFVVLMARMSRARKEKRQDETRSLRGDEQRQVADMRAEMTQMREMMADLLLDMESRRDVHVPAERLDGGAEPDA